MAYFSHSWLAALRFTSLDKHPIQGCSSGIFKGSSAVCCFFQVGTTTPRDMTSLAASSTDISSSMVSAFGTTMMNPEGGFGVRHGSRFRYVDGIDWGLGRN